MPLWQQWHKNTYVRGAILFGEKKTIEDDTIIYVKGAIEGQNLELDLDETVFNDEVWREIYQQKESMGMLLMWLDGYASQKSDNTVLSDEWIEKLGAHMGKYCSENPDTTILDAAQAMEE